jgi:hypothetical protein
VVRAPVISAFGCGLPFGKPPDEVHTSRTWLPAVLKEDIASSSL